MADPTRRIIFIILYLIYETKLISAHYCIWGSCTPDEECCAPHKCCPKPLTFHSNETLYITAWILAGLMIVLLCGGLFKYKNQLCRMFTSQSGDKIPFAA